MWCVEHSRDLLPGKADQSMIQATNNESGHRLNAVAYDALVFVEQAADRQVVVTSW